MALDFIKPEGKVVYSTAEEAMFKEEEKLQQETAFIEEMAMEKERLDEAYKDYMDWV